VRLISFHHRLSGFTGHRYPEALGLSIAAPARGMDFALLISERAPTLLRAELPFARPVLHCPVFRKDWSFDRRTADFVAMLHEHVDPVAREDDWLLVTTSTQCELRALTTWLAETPLGKRPWVLSAFHSDRWNRYGKEERDRQVAELKVVAAELAQLDADAKRRLILSACPLNLSRELSDLLETRVKLMPQVLLGNRSFRPRKKADGESPTVGVLGGSRAEKGSHLLPAIVAETRRRRPISFTIQMANELMSAADFAKLRALAKEPGVRAIVKPLRQKAYRSLLASCDILLFPYERIPYVQRTSGIFIEGAFIGRPAIVPSGTWMAGELAAGNAAGIAYEGDDPPAIADAVIKAVDMLPALSAAAMRHAPRWQKTMSLDCFLDWLEHEIARRRTVRSRLGHAARDWFAKLRSEPTVRPNAEAAAGK
jgi:glycosyltransferase involved in cell wall biosynthesis